MEKLEGQELINFTTLIQSNNSSLNSTIAQATAMGKFLAGLGFTGNIKVAADVGPTPYYTVQEILEAGCNPDSKYNCMWLAANNGPAKNIAALIKLAGNPGKGKSGTGALTVIYAEITGDSVLAEIGFYLLNQFEPLLSAEVVRIYGS